MYFVESFNDIPFQEFTEIIVIPVQSSVLYHRVKNRLSFIYIYDIITKNEYVIGIHHNDLDKNNIKEIQNVEWPKTIYCYKKYILEDYGIKCLDIDMLYWMEYNIPIDISISYKIEKYHNWYYDLKYANDIIPIVLYIDYCRNIVQKFSTINISEIDGIEFYDNLLDNYRIIENNGISVNVEILKKFYNIDYKDDRFYSEYYLYTTTGRPSNRFGHINFAALNKHTGVRGMIVPTNGCKLVEFDYASYHVHLISKLINFDSNGENLHTYLGKIYFGCDELTDDQYEKSKNITFRLINGNIPSEFLEIEFFNKIDIYRKLIWTEFTKNGYIRMPLSGKKIYKKNLQDMNSAKLSNYILQGFETEVNSLILRDLNVYLYNKDTKLILYTYDSFLFDFSIADGKQTLLDIKKILSKFNMTTTIKIGEHYNIMVYKDLKGINEE